MNQDWKHHVAMFWLCCCCVWMNGSLLQLTSAAAVEVFAVKYTFFFLCRGLFLWAFNCMIFYTRLIFVLVTCMDMWYNACVCVTTYMHGRSAWVFLYSKFSWRASQERLSCMSLDCKCPRSLLFAGLLAGVYIQCIICNCNQSWLEKLGLCCCLHGIIPAFSLVIVFRVIATVQRTIFYCLSSKVVLGSQSSLFSVGKFDFH